MPCFFIICDSPVNKEKTLKQIWTKLIFTWNPVCNILKKIFLQQRFQFLIKVQGKNLSFICKYFRVSLIIMWQQHCLSSIFAAGTKDSFFFWDHQSISMFSKLSRHYFHVTTGEFFMNPFLLKSIWFSWSKYFQGWNRRPIATNCFIAFWKFIIAFPCLSSRVINF